MHITATRRSGRGDVHAAQAKEAPTKEMSKEKSTKEAHKGTHAPAGESGSPSRRKNHRLEPAAGRRGGFKGRVLKRKSQTKEMGNKQRGRRMNACIRDCDQRGRGKRWRRRAPPFGWGVAVLLACECESGGSIKKLDAIVQVGGSEGRGSGIYLFCSAKLREARRPVVLMVWTGACAFQTSKPPPPPPRRGDC